MRFTLNTRAVDDEVASFSEATRSAWEACVAVILDDPTPRFGTFTTKEVPIREYPSRTWVYEIDPEVSISGESLNVFASETLPDFLIVYIIDDDNAEIVVVSLRENRRA